MDDKDFDEYIRAMPEPKLQLIDGRLVVGNRSAGNRQLLRLLLDGWTAESALPMATPESWWRALCLGFRRFDPPGPAKPVIVWRSWAAQVTYHPDLPPAGPMIDARHKGTRTRLTMNLYGMAREHRFAHVSGRDVIMRLGSDAFTPDLFLVGPNCAGTLNKHYLEGPADLVIEILSPGQEAQDRNEKRLRYERGGVLEYWIVDPARQTIEVFRRKAGSFRAQLMRGNGGYLPQPFPGLQFSAARLWEQNERGRGPDPFTVVEPMPPNVDKYAEGGVAWDDLPFDPKPELQPRPISFEQFAAWAPEAKVEIIEGKPWVGGSRGSRNVLGLLLRTAGLAEAVTVLHPREWVAALIQDADNRSHDAARREHWWIVARQAADLLRKRFGFGRIAVIGDLVRPDPLNVWSMITLVPKDSPDGVNTLDVSHLLYERFRDEPDVNLLMPKWATRAERESIATEAVEV